MDIEQNSEEKNALLEEQAEHMQLVEYAHSMLNNFEQVDINTVQGVMSYLGNHYIVTFYRTVDDLVCDTWSLSIDIITFAGSETLKDELIVSDWVVGLESYEED